MFYAAIERAATVLDANYRDDFEALALAKSIANLDPNLTVFKRRTAELFFRDLDGHPGCGIYGVIATTSARRADLRESLVSLVFDWLAWRQDEQDAAELVVLQGELAAEAIMRTVDRMGEDQSGGVLGAGELRGSVGVRLDYGGMEEVSSPLTRVRVTVPVNEEDSGLS